MKIASAFVLLPLCFLLLASASLQAECDRSPRRYVQPRQRMDEALQELTHRTGCPVQVELGPLAGHRVPALHGRYSPVRALARLARGTGYTAHNTGEGLALTTRSARK